MSLRRRSCNACFHGRRKCDLTFPTCQRCTKTGKNCHYAGERLPLTVECCSPTASSADVLADPIASIYSNSRTSNSHTVIQDPVEATLLNSDLQTIDFDPRNWVSLPVATDLLGELGNVQPFQGNTESWQWVIEQLQGCPGDFAKTGGNMFVHRSTYRLHSPPAIKAVFGICAASQIVTPATKSMFTSSLESGVAVLLNDIEVNSVGEGLARLQAMILYQILRSLYGDPKQQSAAEQQKVVPNVWALQLLQQMHSDLPRPHTSEELILAESVRRTVMVTYLLHAVNSVFKHRVCPELPTLALLPVSIDLEVWKSTNILRATTAESDPGTMKYGEWTDFWVAFTPRRRLDTFQKMLMVACKGKAIVEELEAEMM